MWRFLKKLKLAYDPANALLNMYLENTETVI